MLHYDRNEVSGEIDINKTSISERFGICHY